MINSVKLDSNFDINLDAQGNLITTSGKDEMLQSLRCELTQNLAQYELNESYGTKWITKENTGIIQNKFSEKKVISEITRVIEKHPEIEKIEKIEMNKETNTLKISIIVDGNNEEVII